MVDDIKLFIVESVNDSTRVEIVNLKEVWEAVWKSHDDARIENGSDKSTFDIDKARAGDEGYDKEEFMDDYWEELEENFLEIDTYEKYVMVPHNNILEKEFRTLGWLK